MNQENNKKKYSGNNSDGKNEKEDESENASFESDYCFAHVMVISEHTATSPRRVAVQFTGAPYTRSNFENYLRAMERCYEAQTPFHLNMDLRRLKLPPEASYFWRQVQFLKEHADDLHSLVLGTLLVTDDVHMTALLKVLFWLVPPRRPYRVCNSKTLLLENLREGVEEEDTYGTKSSSPFDAVTIS